MEELVAMTDEGPESIELATLRRGLRAWCVVVDEVPEPRRYAWATIQTARRAGVTRTSFDECLDRADKTRVVKRSRRAPDVRGSLIPVRGTDELFSIFR